MIYKPPETFLAAFLWAEGSSALPVLNNLHPRARRVELPLRRRCAHQRHGIGIASAHNQWRGNEVVLERYGDQNAEANQG